MNLRRREFLKLAGAAAVVPALSRRAVALDPRDGRALSAAALLSRRLCRWADDAADQAALIDAVDAGVPNIEPMVEQLDMREAQRAYDASISVIETARAMDSSTLDLIKK